MRKIYEDYKHTTSLKKKKKRRRRRKRKKLDGDLKGGMEGGRERGRDWRVRKSARQADNGEKGETERLQGRERVQAGN